MKSGKEVEEKRGKSTSCKKAQKHKDGIQNKNEIRKDDEEEQEQEQEQEEQ